MPTDCVKITDEKVSAMKQKIADVLQGQSSWCVACGAGAKVLKEIMISRPEFLREIITDDTMSVALKELKDIIQASDDWCVACGAGAAQRLTQNPVLSNIKIDQTVEEIVKILNED
jgi:hypothetical protein